MRLLRPAVLLILYVLLAVGIVRPDGIMLPDLSAWRAQRERALINEPEQKAAIFYEKGREQLIISPSYAGPSSNFAWVIPVPARPQVKILRGELFHELARIVEPAPPRSPSTKSAGRASDSASGGGVTLLERKTVGAYDVSVLSATDGNALKKWLDRNRYYLPDSARRPIAAYVRQKWTFVACRIKAPKQAPKQASGLQSGTLAPLHLTFATPHPIYPMRLSSANPRPFKVLLYLIVPAAEVGSVKLTSWPGASPTEGDGVPVRLFARGEEYPTLNRLSSRFLRIFWKKTTLPPESCTRDYIWKTSPW